MKNQCCEYAELIEITAAGDLCLVIGRECPVCGEIELTTAWDRLKDKVERELSPRRLTAIA
jgi:hypothetical protein